MRKSACMVLVTMAIGINGCERNVEDFRKPPPRPQPPANFVLHSEPNPMPVDDQQARPTKLRWFAADATSSTCFEVPKSPGDMIDLLREGGATVSAKESHFSDGALYKVDVIWSDNGGMTTHTNSFYTEEKICLETEVDPMKNLANKYK